MMMQPAVALIEFSSVAVGTRAGDAMLKRAGIATFRAGTIHPGRYLIHISGAVGDVDESYREGLRLGAASVCDQVFLPDAHASVQAAALGKRSAAAAETLGVIEVAHCPAAVHAADVAVKHAAVTIREIRLGDDLGGKGLVHLDGALPDVQAALRHADDVLAPRGIECRTIVIPAVHAGVLREFGESSRFGR